MVLAILLSSFACLSLSLCFYCAVLCYGSNYINWLIFWQEKEPVEEDEAVNISISHVSTGIPLLLVCFQCLLSPSHLHGCTPFFFLSWSMVSSNMFYFHKNLLQNSSQDHVRRIHDDLKVWWFCKGSLFIYFYFFGFG